MLYCILGFIFKKCDGKLNQHCRSLVWLCGQVEVETARENNKTWDLLFLKSSGF